MSRHRSLSSSNKLGAKRNVLKRFERVALLKERGDLFKQVGLPEVAEFDYAAAKIKG